MRHLGNLAVMVERGIEAGRRFEQMRDDLGLFLAGHMAFAHGEMRGKRGEHRQLAGEGLGRGDTDLGARMGR